MSKKLVKLNDVLKGRKTYIAVAMMVVLGLLEGFDIFEVPYSWWMVLTAAGFGFVRSGVNAIEKSIEVARKKGD